MKERFKKIGTYISEHKTIFLVALAVVIGVGLYAAFGTSSSLEEKSYVEFTENLDQVESVEYDDDTLYVTNKDGTKYKTINPSYDTFKKEVLEHGIEIKPKSGTTFLKILPDLLYFGVIGMFIYVLYGTMSDRFGGNRDEVSWEDVEKAIPLDDVAGLSEQKEDLKLIERYISDKEALKKDGITIPKGILLYGPPGTGKTTIAKAIAKDCNVNFYQKSGSEFIELYAGRGAQRVRNLFDKARENAPAIIFIDELDALGTSRAGYDTNTENTQTLTQLLTQMDGFNDSDDLLVIGATNRVEDLDPALLRAGRFTEKVYVPLPQTLEERLESVELYARGKKLADDVDLREIARETIGMSPADIRAVFEAAQLLCVKEGGHTITHAHLSEAIDRRAIGGQIKKKVQGDKEELRLIAWHESGHALVKVLSGMKVQKVTIVGTTTGAGGYTKSVPEKMGLFTRNELEAQVRSLYAGVCSEYLLRGDWGETTTGAGEDIRQATMIIREMIEEYGMSGDGVLLNYTQIDDKEIAPAMKEMANRLKNETIEILKEHQDLLEQFVDRLLDQETLFEKDIKEIMAQNEKQTSESEELSA